MTMRIQEFLTDFYTSGQSQLEKVFGISYLDGILRFPSAFIFVTGLGRFFSHDTILEISNLDTAKSFQKHFYFETPSVTYYVGC